MDDVRNERPQEIQEQPDVAAAARQKATREQSAKAAVYLDSAYEAARSGTSGTLVEVPQPKIEDEKSAKEVLDPIYEGIRPTTAEDFATSLLDPDFRLTISQVNAMKFLVHQAFQKSLETSIRDRPARLRTWFSTAASKTWQLHDDLEGALRAFDELAEKRIEYIKLGAGAEGTRDEAFAHWVGLERGVLGSGTAPPTDHLKPVEAQMTLLGRFTYMNAVPIGSPAGDLEEAGGDTDDDRSGASSPLSVPSVESVPLEHAGPPQAWEAFYDEKTNIFDDIAYYKFMNKVYGHPIPKESREEKKSLAQKLWGLFSG